MNIPIMYNIIFMMISTILGTISIDLPKRNIYFNSNVTISTCTIINTYKGT
jgi:hypothetical protein